MRIVLHGRDLPGSVCGRYEGVHVGLQVGREPVGLVAGDAPSASWETDVSVVRRDGSVDFRGPAVHGKPGDRFLYLTWGEVRDGRFTMFRRAKLMLDGLGPDAGAAAVATGTLSLTDPCGMPLCARIVPPDISWEL